MTDVVFKIIQCFALARKVNHFYWVHTEADENNGHVSIENIQRIVERLTRIPITKKLVESSSRRTMGNFDRYPDHIEIYVWQELSQLDRRFVVVKELCHALIDDPEDYSIDAKHTIREIKRITFPTLDLDGASLSARSEKLAEFMAVELIYPFEYRQSDLSALTAGEDIHTIAERRGVPAFVVDFALGEHLESCAKIWKLLPNENMPSNLEPL